VRAHARSLCLLRGHHQPINPRRSGPRPARLAR
jgi:hypothetical protein